MFLQANFHFMCIGCDSYPLFMPDRKICISLKSTTEFNKMFFSGFHE